MSKITTLFLLLCSSLFVYKDAYATSCGEPRRTDKDECRDPQCSRILLIDNGVKRGGRTGNGDAEYFGHGLCVRGLGENATCHTDKDCFIKEFECFIENPNETDKKGHCVKKSAAAKVQWKGYIGVTIAVFGFGISFVPAKKINPGNGILFQLAMCCGIITTGIITALVRQSYLMYPPSLIGGMLWAVGNSFCIPIIQLVGMGIGLSIWGTTNMLMGWASGNFGLMGIEKETAKTPWRSYIGVVIAVVAIIFFASIRPTPKKTEEDEEAEEENISLNDKINGKHVYGQDNDIADDEDRKKKTREWTRRVIGIMLALCAGAFFGINFNPSQALMDHYDERTLDDPTKMPGLHFSPDGLDYFFSFSLGVMITSVLITVLFYGIHTLPPRSCVWRIPCLFNDMDRLNFGTMVCPGFLSGIIWSVSQLGWFVANTNLGLTVSFPLICLGPSIVANTCGIVFFKEISGKRNFILLFFSILIVGVSCVFTIWSQYE